MVNIHVAIQNSYKKKIMVYSAQGSHYPMSCGEFHNLFRQVLPLVMYDSS